MFLKRIKTPGIAHVAYVLGHDGQAAVIDPRRDIEAYLGAARDESLTIKLVIETHRQEDFVIGSKELSRLTGAKVVTGRHALFGHSDIQLGDGEEISLGGLTLRALATPGHTPESTSYAVFLPEAPDCAWGVFTGDALFIGDAGRTDLPDPNKTAENAGLLYDAIWKRLLPLGDQALLLPAHGAGSVCGGNIADNDHSTIGLERRYNPAFVKSRDAFIAHKVHERIPRPPYFSLMEKVNLKGGLPLSLPPKALKVLPPATFASESKQGLVIDTRDPESFAGGHLPGSRSIWMDGLPLFGGWIADDKTPVFLVIKDEAELETAAMHLERIGVDTLQGALAGGFDAWRDAGLPIERSGTIAPRELRARQGEFTAVDVRDVTEFEDEGHIPGALHVWVGDLEARIAELAKTIGKDQPIATACSVGHRASLAASILCRHGFQHVYNLLGGMTAWEKLGLPMARGAAP